MNTRVEHGICKLVVDCVIQDLYVCIIVVADDGAGGCR